MSAISQMETYKLSSKSFGGSEGTTFQKKLLKLFAIRGLNEKLDFNLWTEDAEADKLDDLVFRYNIGSTTHFTFLQAKHKVNKFNFELDTFFNDKNYNLYKYFKSFLQIEENFKIDYKHNDIDDLILSTNNVLPKTDINGKTCVLSVQTPDYYSALYFEQVENHRILSNEGKLFKFDESKKTENLNFLKNKFLATTFNSFQNDINLIEGKIEIFLNKMLFSTEVEDSALDRNIFLGILQLTNDFSQFYESTNLFDNHFKSWLDFTKPSAELQILRNQNEYLWEKISFLKLVNVFEPIFAKHVLKNAPYKFRSPLKLKYFFDSSSTSLDCHCLIYEVSKGETFWGCLKIFSVNHSIVYLKSSDAEIEKVLNIFKDSSKEFTLVIECDGETDSEFLKKFIGKFAKQSKSNLIIVCSEEIGITLNGYEKLVEADTLCGQLFDDDFNIFKNKVIQFQGFDVALKEIFDEDQLKNISFRKIENLTQIGTPLVQPEIYLPRKLLRKDHLMQNILQQLKHTIVHDEQDYAIRLNGNEEVHLVEIFNQSLDLIWKKSSKLLEKIRPFTSENQKTEILDEEFSKNDNKINIIKDIPGMGKSVFLDFLSYKLKIQNPIHWVQKFELQTCLDELQTIDLENINKENFEKNLSLFIKMFLKLDNEVEELLLERLFREGRVKLLFDGFDEIINSHKEVLIKIICALNFFNNQFYISTRPEWAEMLEDRLQQFAFSFEPFTHADQKNYLLQFWKKDESYDSKTERILEKLDNTVTKREKTFTGIPLVTRLVAEFFKDKIDDMKSFEDSLAKKLSLLELLGYFFEKKIEIFLIKREKLHKYSLAYEQQFKKLKTKHMELALNQIFAGLNETFLSSMGGFDEDDMTEFVRYGLVQIINGKLKFLHHVIAEFMAALYFKENFGKMEIIKFLFNVVLVEKGYQMIRFFIDVFIKDVVNDEVRVILKELIKSHREVLVVAVTESNIQTLEILLDIVYENL